MWVCVECKHLLLSTCEFLIFNIYRKTKKRSTTIAVWLAKLTNMECVLCACVGMEEPSINIKFMIGDAAPALDRAYTFHDYNFADGIIYELLVTWSESNSIHSFARSFARAHRLHGNINSSLGRLIYLSVLFRLLISVCWVGCDSKCAWNWRPWITKRQLS